MKFLTYKFKEVIGQQPLTDKAYLIADNTEEEEPINAIPLTGTEAGNPVTGDIVSNSNIKASSFTVPSFGVNNVVNIYDDGGSGLIGILLTDDGVGTSISPQGIYNNVGGITKSFQIDADDLSWQVSSGNSLFRGIDGLAYFGANYTPNSFAQVKFVTDSIAANKTSQSAITYGASIAIDFAQTDVVRTLALTGNVTFTTTNKSATKEKVFIITASGADRTLTFPAGWIWTSPIPTSVLSGKTGVLYLYAKGTDETDIISSYAPQTN